MINLNTLFKQMTDILSPNEHCEPRFEANLLLEFVLGKTRLELGPMYEVGEKDSEKLIQLCQKRAGGYPLQYILGSWQFFDLELDVGEGVLIPRGDTEDVCLAAFEYINQMESPTVLDLCAGSGAIALAVKKYCPHSNVMALEKYPEAYEYLKRNIEKTGLRVLPVMGDVFRYDWIVEEETFDVIISNPPYINPDQQGKLQKEVEFEPATALFASDEGLRFYKFIAHYYKQCLKEGGYLVFEYGYDQAKAVRNLLLREEYKIVKEIVDTAGNPRGVVAQKVQSTSRSF